MTRPVPKPKTDRTSQNDNTVYDNFVSSLNDANKIELYISDHII